MINNILENSAYWGIAVSVAGYGIGVLLNKKLKTGIANPLLISIVFVIAVLMVFNIDYEKYRESSEILSWLLTPATVCLAVPLYEQIHLLKKKLQGCYGRNNFWRLCKSYKCCSFFASCSDWTRG